jgi:hypothetical protein
MKTEERGKHLNTLEKNNIHTYMWLNRLQMNDAHIRNVARIKHQIATHNIKDLQDRTSQTQSNLANTRSLDTQHNRKRHPIQ